MKRVSSIFVRPSLIQKLGEMVRAAGAKVE